MIELLAVPSWNAPVRTLDDWVTQLAAQGLRADVEREGPGASWLVVAALRLRGYALSEGIKLEGINFELSDPDPGPATQALEAAATALGWEIHPDEPDEDGEDESRP